MSEPTPAPDLTDADLEAMAEVSPSDVEDAREFWERHAPEEYRDLLDSQPDDAEGDG